MKRKRHDHRALLLITGALAMAGIAWGAGLHGRADDPRATAIEPSARVSAPTVAPSVAPAPVAIATTTVAAESHAAPETHVHGEMGMRIFKDPETGEIGLPSPDQMVGDPAYTDESEGLVVERRPDGSLMMDLKGRFQESMVMTIDAQGNRSVQCVQGAAAERKVHEQAQKAAQSSREDR